MDRVDELLPPTLRYGRLNGADQRLAKETRAYEKEGHETSMTSVDNLRRPVDGHVLSHTRFCGWARTFTHTSYVLLPTRTYPHTNRHKAPRNRNARARF